MLGHISSSFKFNTVHLMTEPLKRQVHTMFKATNILLGLAAMLMRDTCVMFCKAKNPCPINCQGICTNEFYCVLAYVRHPICMTEKNNQCWCWQFLSDDSRPSQRVHGVCENSRHSHFADRSDWNNPSLFLVLNRDLCWATSHPPSSLTRFI